jgi:hypothetical protein
VKKFKNDHLSPPASFGVCVNSILARIVERVKKRDGLSPEQIAKLEMHSTEVEVEHRLKEVADLMANNQHSAIECVESIVS